MLNADVCIGDIIKVVSCTCECCRLIRDRFSQETYESRLRDFNPAIVVYRKGDKITLKPPFSNDMRTFDLTSMEVEILERGPAWHKLHPQ